MDNNIRQQAEALINSQNIDEEIDENQDLRAILHELRVHQVELELQNDELRVTQHELARSRDRFSDLYDFAPVGYFTFDTKGVILEVNLTGASQLGVERTYLHSKPFIAHLLRDAHETFYTHLKKVSEFRWRQVCELKIKKRDGSFFYAQMESSGIPNEQGIIDQIHSVVTDITDRKQAQQAKSQFLAIISHELRSPLVGIIGLTDALKLQLQTPENKKQFELLKVIEDSGQRLLHLINDVLDFSRMESCKFDLELRSIVVENVCQASLDLIKPVANKKQIEVFFESDKNVKTLQADERRLKQILVNLLDNAVKFTSPNGKIGLEIKGDNDHQLIYFTVWDNGIGIAKHDIELLFQPFLQLDSRLERFYEGAGLGLSLAHRLAKMHGGDILVESTIGQGSRFTVSLPWREMKE